MEEAWQPDEFLVEFDSDTFDVETHATEILRTGNINEEVGQAGCLIDYQIIFLLFRSRN